MPVRVDAPAVFDPRNKYCSLIDGICGDYNPLHGCTECKPHDPVLMELRKRPGHVNPPGSCFKTYPK